VKNRIGYQVVLRLFCAFWVTPFLSIVILSLPVRADESPTTQLSLPEAEPKPQTSSTQASTQPTQLSEVVVHGRAESLVGIADTSNQGYVGQAQIETRPLLRPAEILETVPGLVITQHSGPGKANQYFLRGFQLDHGTDFAVTLDGVPQNMPTHAHGQGYLDLNYLIPELVDDINFRKGPYYGDTGDFSAAGAADIRYVDTLPKGILSVTGGSYDYVRTLLADSFKLGDGNLMGAIEAYHEGGPWQYTDGYKRINGVLKYSEGNDTAGFRITGFAYHGDWRATDQIPERAVDDGLIGEFGSLNPTDGGNSQHYTLVAEGHQKDANTSDDLILFGSYYDLDLFNDFTYFLNDPVHGDQFEQQDRRSIAGLRFAHSWFTSFLGRDSDNTIGLQFRNDDINNSLHLTEDRVRLSDVRTDHVLESSVGIYAENKTQWLTKFRTEGALRGDIFYMSDDSDNPLNTGKKTSAIFSPKLNLIFGPWAKTEFYLSGGYGYHSNDARSVLTTVSPSTLVPATGSRALTRAHGAEVGVRTSAIPRLQSTLSLFVLDLESELVFDGDTAESVPAGPTRRLGIEFTNYYNLTDWLDWDADYSISQARFTDHEADGDYVPESVSDVLETGFTAHDFPILPKAFGSIKARYFGPRPLTQDDSIKSNSSTLVDAELGYEVNDTWTIKADALNLLNARTDDIEYFYTSRLPGEPAAGVNDKHVHPAEPFELRITLTARF
jgi:hypothetical protein